MRGIDLIPYLFFYSILSPPTSLFLSPPSQKVSDGSALLCLVGSLSLFPGLAAQVCLNTYLFETMVCDKAGPKDIRFTGMKSDRCAKLQTLNPPNSKSSNLNPKP